jgi:putative flavoprotein involved in K+ transport
VQYHGAAASTPALYFVGLPFLHSFTSMFIGGTGRDAERVASHIASRKQVIVWNGRVGEALPVD